MKLFELTKQADVFTKRRLNNELNSETVNTYLKNVDDLKQLPEHRLANQKLI